MKRRKCITAAAVACGIVLLAYPLSAQTYDLLIKGGHVIDPANGVDRVCDVAISGGKIARVASGIPPAQARKIIDAAGLYVTPGLVDMHVHVYGFEGALLPDDTSLITGATTVVDAGGTGWRMFDHFRKTVIARSKTRVLAFLNIVDQGMCGYECESDPKKMDAAAAAETIRRNRDVIVGVKTAHFLGVGWTAIRRAVEAGRLSDTPVMVDDRVFTVTGRTTREKLLEQLRPGDIHTHTFNDRQIELVDRFTDKVQPYVWEARKRGVLFDMGHGNSSFLWPVAIKATSQGFLPDTISTDLYAESILLPQPDMPNCMSKMMSLGMSLQDAVLRATVNPAKAIRRFPELGTLSERAVADVAIFELATGVFALKDSWRAKRLVPRKLECVATVRAGELVYDRDGRGFPHWNSAGEYGVLP